MFTIEHIKKILREADIEGLIADGAPEDEYDSEADDILAEINALSPEEMSVERIAISIQNILEASFGHEYERDGLRSVYLNIAGQIMNSGE